MPQRYCYTPSNPDIAGIGVRWAVYVQATITIAQAWVCRSKYGKPSSSLKAAFIAQYVFLAASLLYIIAEPGLLSSFHRYLAATLAWIGYYSSVVARTLAGNLAGSPLFLVSMEADVVFFAVSLLVLPGGQECIEHPDAPDAHEGAFGWLLLANLVPVTASVCSMTYDSVFGACYASPSHLWTALVVLSELFAIFSVEKALRVSPVDFNQENVWAYGQAVPLALMYIPFSSLIREYTGTGIMNYLFKFFKPRADTIDVEAIPPARS